MGDNPKRKKIAAKPRNRADEHKRRNRRTEDRSQHQDALKAALLGRTRYRMTRIICDAWSFIPLWSERALNESRALNGFHLFRHSAASIVHSVTSDLKLAQELLGHATIATTADIYTHLLDEAKAGAATELLASAFIQ